MNTTPTKSVTSGRRVRRVVAAVGALALVATMGAACSSDDKKAAADAAPPAPEGWTLPEQVDAIHDLVPEKYKSDGLITVGDAQYPPVIFQDADGKVVGEQIDFFQAIGAVMGIPVEYETAKIDAILTGIPAGRYDTTLFNDTPERRDSFDFIDYVEAGNGLLVLAGNPKGLDTDKLCGEKVATVQASAPAVSIVPDLSDACEKTGQPAIDIQQFPDTNATSLALTSGHVDAVVLESYIASYIALQSDGKLEATGKTVSGILAGVMIRKDDPIRPALIEAIKYLMEEGTLIDINKKWAMDSLQLPEVMLNGEPAN